jgi:hypothetical protein
VAKQLCMVNKPSNKRLCMPAGLTQVSLVHSTLFTVRRSKRGIPKATPTDPVYVSQLKAVSLLHTVLLILLLRRPFELLSSRNSNLKEPVFQVIAYADSTST